MPRYPISHPKAVIMVRFFDSLRTRLLMLVLLAVIPAVGLTLYTTSEQKRLAVMTAQTTSRRLARLVAANQVQLINNTRQLLFILAKLPEVSRADTVACSRLFADLLETYPIYTNLMAIRPNGDVFCRAVPANAPANVTGQSYFQQALQTQDFVIAGFQIGLIGHEPALNFAYPVLDKSGQVQSVVAAGLDLSWLNQLAATANLPQGATLTLINREGLILARYPDPEKWVGQSIPDGPLLETILTTGEKELAEIEGLDGIPRLFAFTTLDDFSPNAKVYLSVGIPTIAIYTDSERMQTWNLAGLGLATILALAVAWFGGTSLILHRVNALAQVTKRLKAGDLKIRTNLPHQGAGELSHLADMFDQMVAALEQHEAERDRAEAALAESEARYRLLAENATDLISRHSPDGIYLDVTPACRSLLGYKPQELVGRSIRELCHPEDLGAINRAYMTILKLPITFTVSYRMRHKKGDYTWFETNSRAIHNPETGEIQEIIAVSRDITERVQLEDQFRQSQKMEAIGRLAGGIAHDFNNLLTVITGYSELLLSRSIGDHDPLRREVEQIRKAAQHATELTRQLLAFSRRQMLQLTVLNLKSVVTDMDKMLRRLIGEDIQVTTILPAELGWVKVDQAQLEQVILNLVVNARDAMPQGGKLTIELANIDLDEDYARRHAGVAPGPYIMLAVSDTGVGMDEHTKSQIFEPFFTTKGQNKGTGLGLATVYGIVKQSGGHIWVYSEPDHGTTFKVYLPQVEESMTGLLESGVRTEAPRGQETILLVEDETSVRELSRMILTQNGYTILEAGSGAEALQISEQHSGPIHLLLTDVVMPGMNGRELANRLVLRYPQMKVLFMSGYTDNAIVHHGVLDSDATFLQKPFTPKALANRVRQVLDIPQTNQ